MLLEGGDWGLRGLFGGGLGAWGGQANVGEKGGVVLLVEKVPPAAELVVLTGDQFAYILVQV